MSASKRERAWTDALLEVAEGGSIERALELATGPSAAVAGIQAYHVRPTEGVRHVCSARVDPELVARVVPRFLDPAANPIVRDLSRASIGRFEHIGRFTDFDEYLRSELCESFSRPAGAHHAGTLLRQSRTGLQFFALGIARRASWLDADERRGIERRLDSLGRALELRTRCELATARHGALRPTHAILLDETGAPLFAEEARRTWAVTERALKLERDGRLRPVRDELAAGYAALLERAGAGGSGRMVVPSAGAPCVIALEAGPVLHFGRTLELEARPVLGPPWSRTSLAAAFGLTPRESDVALALLEGRSVRDIASRHAIKEASVRIYLGRVLDKSGTRSQAQLVARLAGARRGG